MFQLLILKRRLTLMKTYIHYMGQNVRMVLMVYQRRKTKEGIL